MQGITTSTSLIVTSDNITWKFDGCKTVTIYNTKDKIFRIKLDNEAESMLLKA